jgi:hypothetical protein
MSEPKDIIPVGEMLDAMAGPVERLGPHQGAPRAKALAAIDKLISDAERDKRTNPKSMVSDHAIKLLWDARSAVFEALTSPQEREP